ncbi:MAG: malate/lactate/ureidoglycolate dehydrogenase [Geminicoccaceae bacterium]
MSDTRVDARGLEIWVGRMFAAAGCPADEAVTIAGHLVGANLVGHDSHGVIRLRDYIPWLERGMVRADQQAKVVHETPVSLTIDGGLGYGQAIGEQAMQLGAAKALASGVCLVGIRNTGHLGRIGHWAERCAEAGLVSLHFVNTSGFGVLVAPFGSREARLSANPIAAGVPIKGGPPLILDISTAAIAEGKIKVARNAGKELPEGVVVDADGKPTRDPAAFYGPPRGAILPFGGHKGSGLSVLIEVLAGALTGGGCTDPQAENAKELRNNMFSLLMRPDVLGVETGREEAVTHFLAWVKGAAPNVPGDEILLPGEIERRTREQRLALGIPLDPATLAELMALGERLGVPAAGLAA